MRWEALTASKFAEAVAEHEVCLLAMGVVEKHGEHLPLGTDYLTGHHIAVKAAEKEPAIVFPPFYFGQIFEARCYPGTLTIRPRLLLELMENLFDDISRNGIKKILVINFHGGNNAFIQFLAQAHLATRRDYSLYAVPSPEAAADADRERWRSYVTEDWGGHAHEAETSVCMEAVPDLVKTELIPAEAAHPLDRAAHLGPVYTGIGWYADFPDHYAGDARKSTRENGAKLVDIMAEFYADCIKRIKEDRVTPGLLQEFYDKGKH